MARLFADEDFCWRQIEVLRQLGHDVVTAYEEGLANQRTPDQEILACATGQGRAVLTHNRRDYKRLHKAPIEHAGIVAAPQPIDFVSEAHLIHQALEACETIAGQLILVNRPVR